MKYVFFEDGSLLEACVAKAGRENVLAFVTTDKGRQGREALLGQRWQEAAAVLPGLDYDYFVIQVLPGSKKEMQDSLDLLDGLGVPVEKRVYARNFLGYLRADMFYSLTGEYKLMQLVQKFYIHSLLDYDMYFAAGEQMSRTSPVLRSVEGLRLGGRETDGTFLQPLQRSLYDSIHQGRWPEEHYEAVLLGRVRTAEEYEALFSGDWREPGPRYYFCQLRCESVESLPESIREVAARHGRLAFLNCTGWSWLLVDTWVRKSVSVFVVAHKPFELPVQYKCYVPIQAGSALHEPLGWLRDDTGENISQLNPYLNEITALYWFWRHDKSEIVGLAHYRRYLLNNFSEREEAGNILDKAHILAYLGEYDILLPELWQVDSLSMENWIRWDVGDKAFTEAAQAIEELLRERQPAYLSAYHHVMAGNSLYPRQMFVTRRAVLDRYCRWLFSFLPDAVARMRPECYAEFSQQRVLGFFGERMLTVWLLLQDLKIKELPVLELKD